MAQAFVRRRRGIPAAEEPAKVESLPLRRHDKSTKALRAATLLDNPEIRSVFKDAREQFIGDLERVKMDGSAASEALVLERVRQLQALLEVQRIILLPLVREKVRNRKVDKQG